MQITLEVKDNYINEFLSFLKLLDDKKVKLKVKFNPLEKALDELKNRKGKTFNSVDELMKDLES